MTSSAKTLRALERAAMRFTRRSAARAGYHADKELDNFARRIWLFGPNENGAAEVFKACARHAAALKRKRTGMR